MDTSRKTKVIAISMVFVALAAVVVALGLTATQNQSTQDSSAAVVCNGIQQSADECYVPVVTQTSSNTTPQTWVDQKTGLQAPGTLVEYLNENFKDLFTSSSGAVTQTCRPVNPSVPKLVSPRSRTEIKQPTVTIEWEKNGTFGKECKDNGKEDRFILKYAVVAKDKTCPSIGSAYKGRQLTVKVAGQKEYSVEMSGLKHDKKYCWFVRAKNGQTKSETKVRSFTVNLSDIAIQPTFPEEETIEVVEGNTTIEEVSNNE